MNENKGIHDLEIGISYIVNHGMRCYKGCGIMSDKNNDIMVEAAKSRERRWLPTSHPNFKTKIAAAQARVKARKEQAREEQALKEQADSNE